MKTTFADLKVGTVFRGLRRTAKEPVYRKTSDHEATHIPSGREGVFIAPYQPVEIIEVPSDEPDPFEEFVRRDLESRGIDPETAERVYRNSYTEDFN